MGSPVRAIAWKNVQAEWRGSGVRLPVIIALGVVAVVWVASLGSAAGTGIQVLATLLLVFAGMAVVLGPYVLRNDLRADLMLWDLLKSYPLLGEQYNAVLRDRDVVPAHQTADRMVGVRFDAPYEKVESRKKVTVRVEDVTGPVLELTK